MMRLDASQSAYIEDPGLGRLALLLVVAGVFNFLVFPVLLGFEGAGRKPIVVGASFAAGVLLGQVGTMTLWLVFGRGSPLKRLFIHWSIVLGLFVPCAIGLMIAPRTTGKDVAEFCITVLLALPLVSLAIQLPLWPLRTHFGWRVDAPLEQGADETPRGLSIRDLLLATVVTAVSLTGVRILHTFSGGSATESDSGYWFNWILGVVCITIVSTVSLPPTLWLALRLKETSKAILAFYGYAFLVATLLLVVIATWFGRLPPDMILPLAFATLSFAATMSLPLIIVRHSGYRLTFPTERNTRKVRERQVESSNVS